MPVDLLEHLTLSEAGVIDAARLDVAKDVTTPALGDMPRFALVGALLATLKAAGDARHIEITNTALDPDQITADPVLLFGNIARLRATAPEDLGTKIARWPEDGDGFALHDNAPGEIGPRTLWPTGFNDGCARQIDDPYEQAKLRVCRVNPGELCGKMRDRLIQSTAFVPIHPEFGGPGKADQ